MATRVRSVLLCEDLQHERLLRPILERRLKGRVRVKRAGGFPFVKKQLLREVRYVRQRPQEAVALVVVTDSDTRGFKMWLEEIRKVGGLTGSAWEERVALCVPTRNVETWIFWLNGKDDVAEDIDYSQQLKNLPDRGNAQARSAAKAWLTTAPARLAVERARLPALAHARIEIGRLENLARS